MRRLESCLTLFNPEFDSPLSSPPRPPPQAPQWLLPSASRLPQVRACRRCLDGGNARGAVAPEQRRSIGSLGSFFWLCSLVALFLLPLSGSNFPWSQGRLLPPFPPRDRPRGALLPLPRLTAPRAPPSRRVRKRTRAATGAMGSNEGFYKSLIKRLLPPLPFFSSSFFFSPPLPLSPAITSLQKKNRCSRRRRRQALHGPPARRADRRRQRPGLRPGHGQEGETRKFQGMKKTSPHVARRTSHVARPLSPLALHPDRALSPPTPDPLRRALSKGATLRVARSRSRARPAMHKRERWRTRRENRAALFFAWTSFRRPGGGASFFLPSASPSLFLHRLPPPPPPLRNK